MGSEIKCDNCGAIGWRQMQKIVPEGWFYWAVADQDNPKEVHIVNACSAGCCVSRWEKGPGDLPNLNPALFPGPPPEPEPAKTTRFERDPV